MDLLLDTKTIFIALVLGHLITAVLISAIWRHYKKDTIINAYFFAKCFQAFAWCFSALRGEFSDVLTISVCNTLTFLGDSLETIAVLKLLKEFNQLTKKIYFVLTVSNIYWLSFDYYL